MSDQKWWAYYELIVTNTTDWPLVLERLEVTDADDPSKVRADMGNGQIAEYPAAPGRRRGTGNPGRRPDVHRLDERALFL